MARLAIALVALSLVWFGYAASAPGASTVSMVTTCGDVKTNYKDNSCCGAASKEVNLQIVPGPKLTLNGANNPCAGAKLDFPDHACMVDGLIQAVEQAGGDVTLNFKGGKNVTDHYGRPVMPITDAYYTKGLCPVNVHWHLGAEHRSVGEFDENGKGPGLAGTPSHLDNYTRRLAAAASSGTTTIPERYGYACSLYDAADSKFTTQYKWQHCDPRNMFVGETYEIHWPHSGLGACHTPNQYQTPFYDGVFCNHDPALHTLTPEFLSGGVGVQSQVFTIVNDESFYYPDLMRGMIVDGTYGKDITAYTGSTTGTGRNNALCSQYGPITWQVDRKCHLISASSFDKMCADMMLQKDDMSGDLYPHGARELVANELAAHNLQRF
jgi:hypothetical protein